MRRTIEVNGRTVFVGGGGVEAQEGAPVVFIHGAGMDHTVWTQQVRNFARRGHRVIAPDLPGHGRTDGPPLASIAALGDWVGELLDALAIEQAALVGHSMGSLIAYRFASAHPDRCRALALVGTSVPMPVTDALLNAARDNHHAALDMANTWSHSDSAKSGGNQTPGVWMMGAGIRLLERAKDGVFFADLTACNGFDVNEIEGSPECPSLVIAGTSDMMTPLKAGLDVASRLDDPKVLTLAGVGHSIMNEAPNDVLDALIDLLG